MNKKAENKRRNERAKLARVIRKQNRADHAAAVRLSAGLKNSVKILRALKRMSRAGVDVPAPQRIAKRGRFGRTVISYETKREFLARVASGFVVNKRAIKAAGK